MRQFNDIDTGRRERITLDEATDHYARRFEELDLNHDGILDATEIAPMLPLLQATTPEELIRRIDNDGNGRVSKSEFQILANLLFQRSRTGDGTLTLADASRPLERGARPQTASGGGPAGKVR